MDRPRQRVTALTVGLCLLMAQGARAQDSTPTGESAPEQSASLDDATRFAQARSFYEAGSYQQCRETFKDLLDRESDRRLQDGSVIESARVYYAACLIALKEFDAAEAQMEAALRENPLMGGPSPVVFPKPVVDFFFSVRAKLQTEINQQEQARFDKLRQDWERNQRIVDELRTRVARLEQEANNETVVQKNSRLFAAVPFGVGQFQNDNDGLGWILLVSEALMAGTTIAAVSIELGLHSQAEGGRNVGEDTDAPQVARDVSRISLAALLVTAAAGIVEAQLNFVPEIRLGERPRKEGGAGRSGLGLSPVITAEPGSATLGLFGRF